MQTDSSSDSHAALPQPDRRLLVPLRVVLIVAGLAAWFGTQGLIGARQPPSDPPIGDSVLEWTAGANTFLTENPRWADWLLIVSSAIIDLLAVYLLGSSVCGRTIRPFLGLLIVFGMRQVCQGLCSLPAPPGMIWRHPGFPSLLVTYGVSNDLFFSGHTALAVLGAIELGRGRSAAVKLLGSGIVALEIATVILLRAHWTMDVVAGAMAALLAATAAQSLAPRCDELIARLLPAKA